MLKKQLDYLTIPALLAKRDDKFWNYDTADTAIITYILYYSYNNKYEAQFNIKSLLKWFGLKNHIGNIQKVKMCLLKAQDKYADINPMFRDEGFGSIQDIRTNTLATISFKPEFIPQIEATPYKRIPLSNISAIANYENHTVLDFSCYYLLLAGASNYDSDLSTKDEIETLESKYYSISRIAAIFNVSTITVKRALIRLEELGVIRCDEKRKIGMTSNGFYSDPITYRFAIV